MGCKPCQEQRAKVARAAKRGNIKEAAKATAEGVLMMINGVPKKVTISKADETKKRGSK